MHYRKTFEMLLDPIFKFLDLGSLIFMWFYFLQHIYISVELKVKSLLAV